MRSLRSLSFYSSLALLLSFAASSLAQTITSPDDFFGFKLGADRKMARWDKIVQYYDTIEKQSGGRMKVVRMHPTEEGNPFLMVYISSPKNLANLEEIRKDNLTIVHPQSTPEAEVKKLIATGKVVMVQSMSMHATEIGGTQMAPQLAYDLLTRKDEAAQRILDNVVFIEVPCFNPDGEIMVTDWYNSTLGTPYEGVNYPSLYAKYIGHDDNRDAFMTQMAESKDMASILFTDWRPEVYVDHHHMGSYGPRISLPPYAEPTRPYADPLTWREISWYGAQMAYKESENNLPGAINNAIYSGWGHFGFHWITPFHNIDGMLTESASAKLATPMYIQPEQLEGGARNLPKYEEETIFPDPWKGGWWHLSQIVKMQETAAWATLDIAARNRETVLWNAYQKAIHQTERGAAGTPKEYVIPTQQFDPLTAQLMVQKLLVQGIDIQKLNAAYTTSEGHTYEPGSYVISLAQPKMGLIRYLLDRNFFPDNYWTRDKSGTPIKPYDLATDAMYEFMGVRVDHVDETIKAPMTYITTDPTTAGKVGTGASAYVFSGKLDESFKVMNQLEQKGATVSRVDKAAPGVEVGDFIVTKAPEGTLQDLAKTTGVSFTALSSVPSEGTHELKRLRIGLYQRYYGGNVDEGWTRWLLEQYGYNYVNIFDPEIKQGNLNAKYDIIVIPDDPTSMLMGNAGEGPGRGFRGNPTDYPPKYRSGLGKDGAASLKAFVQQGGTIVTLGQASKFAMDQLGVGAEDVLAHTSTKEFWCPGSNLKVNIDNTDRLAYGMPKEGLALFLQGDPVFDMLPSQDNQRFHVVVTYQHRDILESGWLVGEGNITDKPAMISAEVGKGDVIMIGFRAQHRAQTYGTFKLFFNSLVN